MIKICYVDFWADLAGSPLTVEEINNPNVWSKLLLSRHRFQIINQGIGLLHFNELQKYMNVQLVDQPEKADVLICSCFGDRKEAFPEKKKIFLGFESSCNQEKYVDLPNCLFISNYSAVINHPNSLYLNLYCLYHGFSIYQQLQKPKIYQPKKRFCLSIISNTGQNFRTQFIQKLSQYSCVDNYGRLLQNHRDPTIEHSTWYDPRLIDTIKKYKFMICFENQSINGYHTEKLVMGLLGETIPIYWGDPMIGQYFNQQRMINVNQLGVDHAIQKIIELDQNETKYQEVWNYPACSLSSPSSSELNQTHFRTKIKEFILP